MGQPLRPKDIRPGSLSSNPYLSGAGVMGGQLLFVVINGANGPELWSTDGTSMGTRLVRENSPSDNRNTPENLTVFANRLVFNAVDSNGTEPWISDGTAAGTALLKNIAPGLVAPGFPNGSYPIDFTPFANRLFFTASQPRPGR